MSTNPSGLPMWTRREAHRLHQLLVLGVGGRGCAAIDHLAQLDCKALQLIAINTDSRPLARVAGADRVILLGDGGEGAGGVPGRGRAAAELCEAELRDALAGARRLLIVAGLGGGTGSGAAPVVARIARQMGISVDVAATLPFAWEGRDRADRAQAALHGLRLSGAAVHVMPNDALMALGEDVSQEAAFAHADAQVATLALTLAGEFDAV